MQFERGGLSAFVAVYCGVLFGNGARMGKLSIWQKKKTSRSNIGI